MKFFRKLLILLLLSLFLTFLILIFFKPILTAKNLNFPYALHPFDIAHDYPKAWFYMKLIYCLNLFITIFLTLNSISRFFNFTKSSTTKTNPIKLNSINENKLNLLIGFNSDNQTPVFIPEKGLYQNILVTGTIGSRKNQFCDVSIFRTIN